MKTVENKQDFCSKIGASLGNNTGTEASHERRGFQTIDIKLDLVEEVDQETGEITTFLITKTGKRVYRNFQESRSYRYFLKAAVSVILNESRILKCLRVRYSTRDIEIIKSKEHGKCRYGNLVRCASPWGCPVCAAQISERRKVEVKTAIATAKMMNWDVVLMTCTVPHGLGDDVNLIRDKLAKAWRKMTTGRAGKELRKLLEVQGTIRAMEVTYGENGFHPHYHVLIFSKKKASPELYQSFFAPIWQDACVKSGLSRPSDLHGLDVRNGEHADSYVSKGAFGLEKDNWGLESELTKGHTKLSKSKTGSTPFGLLEEYATRGCERSKRLFLVYFHAFKGSRQLYWSNGLKSKLSIQETTDPELIAQSEDDCFLLATLNLEQWKAVLNTRTESALLDLAERNPEQIPAFLEKLCE